MPTTLVQRLPGLLTYAEYLSPTRRANALSCRTFVLHDDGLGILDLNLFPAFHAICLHLDLLMLQICF